MNDDTSQTLVMKSHDHGVCIKQAMEVAEKICNRKNIRLTPMRKRILELICGNHKAIGAYELLDIFRKEDPKAKPVTIYRALDFFMEAGLVHKVESINAYIGCLQAETVHHSVILICEECHCAYEVDAEQVFQNLIEISEIIRFKPKWLTLELHGICASCNQQT